MKNGENFKLLYTLADKLGAAGKMLTAVEGFAPKLSLCWYLLAQWVHHEPQWMLALFPMTCRSGKQGKSLHQLSTLLIIPAWFTARSFT